MSNIELKIKAQKEYCEKHNVPHFAPNDGVCWCCNNQIYEHISIEKASNELITGCPCCNRSYCD